MMVTSIEAPAKLLLKHTATHLELLGYGQDDVVRLRSFPPTGKGVAQNIDTTPRELLTGNTLRQVQQLQQRGWGLYVVVNPGGHEDSAITQGVAIFYEYDTVQIKTREYLQQLCPNHDFPFAESRTLKSGKVVDLYTVPMDAQQMMWAALGLPEPSLQVNTGGKSVHSYWIFDEPISVTDWRALQTDLMEFADSDRTLKNPSRVMRLAGSLHTKTGNPGRIVGGTGKPIAYQDIRAAIPVYTPPPTASQQRTGGMTWTEFDRSFSLPTLERIPLDICLSRDSRDLLVSGAVDYRNDSGAKLARDLIGTANYLKAIGQAFDGDPEGLFTDYCHQCSQDDWSPREWAAIWKSAEAGNPGPSLSPDKIENCAKSWVWKNHHAQPDAPAPAAETKSTATAPTATPEPGEELDQAQALRVAVQGYADEVDKFQKAVLGIQIRKDFSIGIQQLDNLVAALQPRPKRDPELISDLTGGMLEGIEQRAMGLVAPGISTGFYDLDGMTQGFQRTDLIIVAGRPSMGKSAFVGNLARNMGLSLSHELPVAVFTLEMSKDQVLQRMLSSECSLESWRLRMGKVADHEWGEIAQGIDNLAALPVLIDDSEEMGVKELENKLAEIHEKHGGIGAVIIDYLQLMSADINVTNNNRNQELGIITRKLKALAKKYHCPVIALSQLSRSVESRTNKRPMMSDLRESGNIEQDSDVIMMLYREEYYDPETPDRGIAEVIIAKHRNGPVGTVKLLFEPQFSRFRNLAV